MVRLLRDQQRPETTISIPSEMANATAVLHIRLEDGSLTSIPVELAAIPVSEEAFFGGSRFVRKRIPLPHGLPLGYHELSIEMGGIRSPPARLIACPQQAYQPAWLDNARAAGLAVSLYGIRSARNWGCGDTSDLKPLIDWVVDKAGASFIALNPLHAIANRQPYNTSPYLPNSIFYRNPIYLDLEQIEEFRSSERARALLASDAVQQELHALRHSELVEYERVYRLKLRFLKILFRAFLKEWAKDAPRARELRQYMDGEGELLHRFAVHEAFWIRLCTGGVRMYGTGAPGRNLTKIRSRRKCGASLKNTGAASCSTNTCSGNWTCS